VNSIETGFFSYKKNDIQNSTMDEILFKKKKKLQEAQQASNQQVYYNFTWNLLDMQ
jgi:hypothetical protein